MFKSDFLRKPADRGRRGFMKVILGTSHYVILVTYDHNRKNPTGKNFAPKIGQPEILVTYEDFEDFKM